MKEYFLKLFRYNEWANNRILEVLVSTPVQNGDILKLFSHMISAQRLWLERILNSNIIFEIWNTESLEGCIQMSKESSLAWIKFLEKTDEASLKKSVHYVNTKGLPFDNTIEDILAHVINHSTYHRAQLARMLRQEDIQPPVTDYIVFRR